MDFRHLHYFVVVAEELNMTRAASRLGITQPPLTRIIHHLEEELGVQLLDRSKRQMALTPAGQAFYDQISPILAQYQHAVQLTRRIDQRERERLQIGYTGAAIYSILPDIMRMYSEQFPETKVVLHDLSHLSQRAQIQALREHRVDVGFMSFPPMEKEMKQEQMLDCPLAVILPATHPLAHQEAISLAALAEESWIWCSRRTNPHVVQQLSLLCLQAGFEPRIVQTVTHLHSKVSLVAAGIGIAVVAAWERAPQLKRDGVIYRSLKDITWRIDLQMVWREKEKVPQLLEFLNVVREACRGLVRNNTSQAMRSPFHDDTCKYDN